MKIWDSVYVCTSVANVKWEHLCLPQSDKSPHFGGWHSEHHSKYILCYHRKYEKSLSIAYLKAGSKHSIEAY